MHEVSCDLTVYFENPYWVGEYKRISGQKIETSKTLFDDEPLISQMYNYYLKNWNKLEFNTTYQ